MDITMHMAEILTISLCGPGKKIGVTKESIIDWTYSSENPILILSS
jgi:hypothetical protein